MHVDGTFRGDFWDEVEESEESMIMFLAGCERQGLQSGESNLTIGVSIIIIYLADGDRL
jgi:hypothetical protein